MASAGKRLRCLYNGDSAVDKAEPIVEHCLFSTGV